MVVIANGAAPVLPVAVFGALMLLFALQARRRGQPLRGYLAQRDRDTFLNLKPRWWRPHVAFAAAVWTAVFVASGFKLVLLAALPVVVLWVPVWGLVSRAYYRRRESP